MKVRVTVVERITKDAEVDIPDIVHDIKVYCSELYNNGDLDERLEIYDSTAESISVEELSYGKP